MVCTSIVVLEHCAVMVHQLYLSNQYQVQAHPSLEAQEHSASLRFNRFTHLQYVARQKESSAAVGMRGHDQSELVNSHSNASTCACCRKSYTALMMSYQTDDVVQSHRLPAHAFSWCAWTHPSTRLTFATSRGRMASLPDWPIPAVPEGYNCKPIVHDLGNG